MWFLHIIDDELNNGYVYSIIKRYIHKKEPLTVSILILKTMG